MKIKKLDELQVEEIEEVKEKVKEAEEVVAEAPKKRGRKPKAETVKEKVEEVKEKVEEKVEEVKEKVQEKVEDIKKDVKEVTEKPASDEESEELKAKRKAVREAMKLGNTYRARIVALDREDNYAVGTCDEFGGAMIKIPYNEFGNTDAGYLRPNQLMSMVIPFKIIGLSPDGMILGGGKELAIEKVKELQEKGEKIKGQVVYFMKYGAFIKVKGYPIYGILRNDRLYNEEGYFLRVVDYFKQGDNIPVHIDSFDEENGKLYFNVNKDDMVVKRKYPDGYFKEGLIVEGKVTNISGKGVFVNLDTGVDGICSIPPELEGSVFRESRVYYKITRVSDEGQISGRIIGLAD